ncbi:hypothetical protein ACIBCT_14030 [Streptosporangium sp. NPDC050855]|uniref:hypothetical protein n=1 Tax=Streptosporangium sp. NPDC050855 TaxID=3366194 RepID=UPI0037A2AFEC
MVATPAAALVVARTVTAVVTAMVATRSPPGRHPVVAPAAVVVVGRTGIAGRPGPRVRSC